MHRSLSTPTRSVRTLGLLLGIGSDCQTHKSGSSERLHPRDFPSRLVFELVECENFLARQWRHSRHGQVCLVQQDAARVGGGGGEGRRVAQLEGQRLLVLVLVLVVEAVVGQVG